jgi:hypothetical protein
MIKSFYNDKLKKLVINYKDIYRTKQIQKQPEANRILKSEVAIASLFCQTKQPKTFLLQVKTITKSPGTGIAESVKSCKRHQKGSFKA